MPTFSVISTSGNWDSYTFDLLRKVGEVTAQRQYPLCGHRPLELSQE